MEEKIADRIGDVVTGSYIFPVLSIGIIIGASFVMNGRSSDLLTSTAAIWSSIFFLYVLSLYLIITIPGKTRRRRLISWTTSAIFHFSLLLYLAIYLGAGWAALIFGIPEAIISALSIIGFALCLSNTTNGNCEDKNLETQSVINGSNGQIELRNH